MKDFIGRSLFSGRWLLAYFYIGLQLAMVLYAYKYTVEIIEMIRHVTSSPEDEFMLSILGLVDIVMIANLIDMIKSGSYTIFIRRVKFHQSEDQPQWLDHMSTGLQKVKMSASILGISSIHLLKSFVNASHEPWDVIKVQLIIHATFIIGTVALALTERITSNHPTKTNEAHH